MSLSNNPYHDLIFVYVVSKFKITSVVVNEYGDESEEDEDEVFSDDDANDDCCHRI